mmetsp:Transcript_8439/g.15912  ORF Transcript_8439/g.15912 Transcript_8439/m.15912 type:complete len:85 (-) Transcript_8439:466-720(-)
MTSKRNQEPPVPIILKRFLRVQREPKEGSLSFSLEWVLELVTSVEAASPNAAGMPPLKSAIRHDKPGTFPSIKSSINTQSGAKS